MNPKEKFVDFKYTVAAKFTSLKTGRPTAIEKEVLEGPRVNGVIRPDLADSPLLAVHLAAETGQIQFVEYHAREVRRRIVFQDETTSKGSQPDSSA